MRGARPTAPRALPKGGALNFFGSLRFHGALLFPGSLSEFGALVARWLAHR
jgi:hypothetical protein